jgi:hypothetical protein
MDTLIESSWRFYPAMALAVLGGGLVILGVHWQFDGFLRSAQNATSLRKALRGFRLMVIGLGLLGVAAAWQWTITWLFVLSAAFAGEETFESSLMLGALGSEQPIGKRADTERVNTEVDPYGNPVGADTEVRPFPWLRVRPSAPRESPHLV